MEQHALAGRQLGILVLDQLPQLMGVIEEVSMMRWARRRRPARDFPLLAQGLGDGFVVRQGVLPPGLAEAPDEGLARRPPGR